MNDAEPISPRTINSISFICSFGYSVKGFRKGKKNRMNDVYTLKDHNGDVVRLFDIARRDFYNYIKKHHKNVSRCESEPDLNSTIDYDLYYLGA